MVKECQNDGCNGIVSDDWARCWTQDGTVHRCPDCLPDGDDNLRHLNAGAAAKEEYELHSKAGHRVV